MKKLQAVRMGAGDDIQASNELEGEVELDEARFLAAMQAEERSVLPHKKKKMGTSSTSQDFGHDSGISSAERRRDSKQSLISLLVVVRRLRKRK